MLINSLLAFATALFTGITLRTPKSAWITVGITGMMGWATSEALSRQRVPELVVAVAGALMIGALAEILARFQKQPVTVYIVSGIIPLVPGTTAYNSMLAFLERNFDSGLYLAFKAFLIASYLAAGLAVAPLFIRYLRSALEKSYKINRKNKL